MKSTLRVVCVNVTLLTTACLGAEPMEVASRSDAIVDGELTSSYTGVARLGARLNAGCSGVMIGPKKLLTAAHCFNYGDRDNDGSVVTFDGHAEAVLGAVRVLGTRAGASDLAVGELDRDVSGEVEIYKVDTYPPPDGTPAVIVGWGCIAQEWSDFSMEWLPTDSGGGLKRVREVTYAAGEPGLREDAACPGDSGGPIFMYDRARNQYSGVIGITSAARKPDENGNTHTILADPIAYLDQIENFCIAPDTKHVYCDGPDLGGPGIDYECEDNSWVEVGGFCENIHH